jgi:hypothetical protein
MFHIRRSAAAVGAVLAATALAACGSTGSTTTTYTPAAAQAPTMTATASALERDVQRVQSAATVGQLRAADAQLSHDLTAAQSVPSSPNSGIDAQWRQALSQLRQALGGLAQAAPAGGKASAPSPLQSGGGGANTSRVKQILDELSSGLDLLERVVKDIAALHQALHPANTAITTTSTTQTTPTPTPANGTYTLTVVNSQQQDGIVTSSGNHPDGGIACGENRVTCKATELTNAAVTVYFDGGSDVNGTGKPYVIKSIQSTNGACQASYVAGSTRMSSTICDVTANADTTITVEWVLS